MRIVFLLAVLLATACGGDSTSPSSGLDGNWSAQVASGATTYAVTFRLLPFNNGLYSGFGQITPSINGGASTAYLDVSALPFSSDSVSVTFNGGGPLEFFTGTTNGSATMSGQLTGTLSGAATFTKQ